MVEYPCSSRFLRNLVKQLHANIEGDGAEISDEWAEFVVSVMSSPMASEEDAAYYSYIVPVTDSNKDSWIKVPLRCVRDHNLVGLKVWNAGMALSELLIGVPSIVQSKRVIELGAGVGNTGILLAVTTPLKSLVMTDFNDDINDNLRHNVDINKSLFKCEVDPAKTVQMLDWRAAASTEDVQYLGLGDVILAADCTYSEDICGPLLQAIHTLLVARAVALSSCPVHEQSDLDSKDEQASVVAMASPLEIQAKCGPMAIVVSEERNQATWAHFLLLLRKHPGLRHQDFTEWAMNKTEEAGGRFLHYGNRDKLHFIAVTL
jgi:predicted nicotinamide N-methyase